MSGQKAKTYQKREPEPTNAFNPVNSFDDSFVALDSPDDAAIEQKGNGVTLVANDNPDDVEDKLVR